MQARSRSAYVSPSTIALVYAGLGETEAAMSALEQAHAVRDIRLVFLQTDHRWAALRKLPRFAALAARLKLDGVRPPARSPF